MTAIPPTEPVTKEGVAPSSADSLGATSPLPPVHIVHLVYRFAAGGLENVIVQLVDGLPQQHCRHTIVALTQIDARFSQRIRRPDVDFVSLNKAPGQPFGLYPRMYALLRRLKPDVLHSCNIAALEFSPVAALACVPLRIHAEHGWDVADPHGDNRRYQWLRRAYAPFVHQFIVVSNQLRDYLLNRVRISADRVVFLPNGVDTQRFRPWQDGDSVPAGYPFKRGVHWVIGTVGRLEPIKNPELLARAFVRLVRSRPAETAALRLAMIGAGPLEEPVRAVLAAEGLGERLWMPGARSDVADILRVIDCFVLPSRSEGTSCTLQEAMSTGVPIIATDVGGNRQTLFDGRAGELTADNDEAQLAERLFEHSRRKPPSTAAVASLRQSVATHCGLGQMLARYAHLFGIGA